ncbi:hypothetical protein Dimus_012007 [Dionaea muscipula]
MHVFPTIPALRRLRRVHQSRRCRGSPLTGTTASSGTSIDADAPLKAGGRASSGDAAPGGVIVVGAPADHTEAASPREDAVEEGDEPEEPREADEGDAGEGVPGGGFGLGLGDVEEEEGAAGGDADEEEGRDYPYVAVPCPLLHIRHLNFNNNNSNMKKKI